MLFETTFRSLSLFFKHRLFLFLFPLLQRLSTCATVRWYKIAVWIENFSSSTMKCSFWQTIVECYQIEYVHKTARKLCLYDFFFFRRCFRKVSGKKGIAKQLIGSFRWICAPFATEFISITVENLSEFHFKFCANVSESTYIRLSEVGVSRILLGLLFAFFYFFLIFLLSLFHALYFTTHVNLRDSLSLKIHYRCYTSTINAHWLHEYSQCLTQSNPNMDILHSHKSVKSSRCDVLVHPSERKSMLQYYNG